MAPTRSASCSSVDTVMDDPIAASYRLYSLMDSHDRTVEQIQNIDAYILAITEKIVKDSQNGGHVGHGMLLLTRKCVAEGVRVVYVKLASRKWAEVLRCYDFILDQFEADDDRFADVSEELRDDHEVMKIARGLAMESSVFQRGC